ncbi:MAG: heme ABC transporter permease [Hydrogenovibrio sp.]|uniref:heme ABC transporter permease n=1 Tax=Hydrogenovibrio sp. TaxID=2065821 RepID=UPI00287087B7|nr:heme ABC transporter permease [Hydrogenovibrio sp.]MDR9499899.1 heme ABC transporter permease [Hydrogenovibrio sp.]
MQRIRWKKYASSAKFDQLANRLVPVFVVLTLVTAIAGFVVGFILAPVDYQQGNSYRIMFVHVPAAWMSMFLYLLMAFYSVINLVWRIKMADVMAYSLAPTGAMFTFLALWTGALWGKPTWGTYWVWDARLTSELILLFLYLGYLALYSSIPDRQRASRAASFLAIVGVINVPIIYFSVRWWNTLHQGASITLSSSPTMTWTMFTALILLTLTCWFYAIAVVLRRAQAVSLERKRMSLWASLMSKK